jgi:hypothetical protein
MEDVLTVDVRQSTQNLNEPLPDAVLGEEFAASRILNELCV